MIDIGELKSLAIGDLTFDFHVAIGTVKSVKIWSETSVSGGGGYSTASGSGYSTTSGSVNTSFSSTTHIDRVTSSSSTKQEIWLTMDNGMDYKYPSGDLIECTEGHRLAFVVCKQFTKPIPWLNLNTGVATQQKQYDYHRSEAHDLISWDVNKTADKTVLTGEWRKFNNGEEWAKTKFPSKRLYMLWLPISLWLMLLVVQTYASPVYMDTFWDNLMGAPVLCLVLFAGGLVFAMFFNSLAFKIYAIKFKREYDRLEKEWNALSSARWDKCESGFNVLIAHTNKILLRVKEMQAKA